MRRENVHTLLDTTQKLHTYIKLEGQLVGHRCFSDRSFVRRVIIVVIHAIAIPKFFRNRLPHSIVVVGHVPELIYH